MPAADEPPHRAALVESAEALRWSAPELVEQFARRALEGSAGAGGDSTGSGGGAPEGVDAVVMRAQALLGGALVRLGRHAEAVQPATAGLRAAEASGWVDLATAIRLDLAACSRGVGEPLIGCAVLGPVLQVPDVRPVDRAMAIGQLVGCAAPIGRRD